MKKLFLSIALFSSLFMASCGGDKKEGETTEGAATVADLAAGEYDLTAGGLPFVIKAPNDPAITSPVAGSYELKCSELFQMQINEGAGDLELVKSDIKTNEVFKFKRFIAEEANGVFYESEFQGKPSFHFFVVQKTGSSVYEIQDNKAKQFSEEDTKTMFESAKSIKAKA